MGVPLTLRAGVRREAADRVIWTAWSSRCFSSAANSGHSLRIPETAEPWDSGILVDVGDSFAVTLTEEGVYDYYCGPHEIAGMVGRIIVGRPGGPGLEPFDYFTRLEPPPDWQPVPEAAQAAFPSVEEILRDGRVAVG